MVNLDFRFAHTPRILFGAGTFARLPEVLAGFGRSALIVTGSRSLAESGRLSEFLLALSERGVAAATVAVQGEPSTELVDQIVTGHGQPLPDVVAAIGGGSVLDTGKAVSAMLPSGESVTDYLEGVGHGRPHPGRKVPLVAVPTTAGTGSEATKNAVISRVGRDGGFKKSLRHDRFVPDVALVDPELAMSCPPHITAACGLDAFTQLLESYVSTAASPLTDALAWSGLARLKDSLIPALREGRRNLPSRAGMAYAALLSGITLTNAGLGVVHGLASPLGAAFPIPHGVVCGTLVGVATRTNVDRILARPEKYPQALEKYARVGRLLAGHRSETPADDCRRLLMIIDRWVRETVMPRLGDYGIGADDLDSLAAAAGIKNNPVPLDKIDLRRLLSARL
ncbi:MAG: iron-containing alcohol dehydrogenase [Acidobacteria bacterium]|nr:iron-containing alcohol dehydrogenase [Acidobacteriota bacterium]